MYDTCNNLLTAVYLSSTCPVFIAPSMDLDMYNHPANKKNISKAINLNYFDVIMLAFSIMNQNAKKEIFF